MWWGARERSARGQERLVGRPAAGAAVGVEEEKIVLVAGLFLGVGALGLSLRRSQRDPDFRGEIIYVPVNHNVYLEER